MIKTCELCDNNGYIKIYNTLVSKTVIERCDDCWSDNKPWSCESDKEAKEKKEREVANYEQ